MNTLKRAVVLAGLSVGIACGVSAKPLAAQPGSCTAGTVRFFSTSNSSGTTSGALQVVDGILSVSVKGGSWSSTGTVIGGPHGPGDVDRVNLSAAAEQSLTIQVQSGMTACSATYTVIALKSYGVSTALIIPFGKGAQNTWQGSISSITLWKNIVLNRVLLSYSGLNDALTLTGYLSGALANQSGQPVLLTASISNSDVTVTAKAPLTLSFGQIMLSFKQFSLTLGGPNPSFSATLTTSLASTTTNPPFHITIDPNGVVSGNAPSGSPFTVNWYGATIVIQNFTIDAKGSFAGTGTVQLPDSDYCQKCIFN